MKGKITHVLALVLAVLVLCAPVSAMADSYDTLTLTLSDFSLALYDSIADTDSTFDIDATLKLDIGYDAETESAAGALTALAGDTVALRGGFSFDESGLAANLDGMTKSILVPVENLTENLQASLSEALGEEELAQIAELISAYEDLIIYMSDADHSAAYAEKATALLAERFGDGYQGRTTLDLDDWGTVDVEAYDFSMTIAELMTTCNDLMNIDPEAAACYQRYLDALSEISGEDISDVLSDPTLYEDIDVTLSGTFFFNEDGAVLLALDITGTEDEEEIAIPMEFIFLPDETSVQFSFYMQATEYGDTVDITVSGAIPTDGSTNLEFTLLVDETDEDGDTDSTAITLVSDGENGDADVTLYCENVSSFTYDDETYEFIYAFGFNYAGTSVMDDSGLSFPGVLTLYANDDGSEITVQAVTNVQLHTLDAAPYTVTGTPVDITAADEDALEALSEDAMSVVMSGAAILMSAPGLSDLLEESGLY